MRYRSSILLAMFFVFCVTACGDTDSETKEATMDLEMAQNPEDVVLSDDFEVQDHWIDQYERPSFVAESGRASMPDAIQYLTQELGTPGKPLEWLEGVHVFQNRYLNDYSKISYWNSQLMPKGVMCFQYRASHGINNEPDILMLVPTTDWKKVMLALETNGYNYDLTPHEIITWLERLESQHPIELYGIGFDFIAGAFKTPPQGAEAKSIATAIYEFCPDIVDQGVGSIDRLADSLEKGFLYFWWD